MFKNVVFNDRFAKTTALIVYYLKQILKLSKLRTGFLCFAAKTSQKRAEELYRE